MRSCGNEVYKMEKSKEVTWEPWKLHSCNLINANIKRDFYLDVYTIFNRM